MSPVLKVRNLSKTFSLSRSMFRHTEIQAVKPVSFSLNEGKTLAIIGQNGSGKSTLAKMLVGMIEPTSGEIWVEDNKLEYGDYQTRCQLVRMIFQNPDSSFDPRLRIGQLLEMPLKQNTDLDANEREKLIYEVLKQVGLLPDHAQYYPSVMAAGQKQRVALARALILKPKVIIADEALAALDISMRSQIINLMLSLQEEQNISYVYVTQDIGMMKHISDQILVMQDGEVVENGNTAEVLASPLSDVTKKLVQSYFGEALTADTWRKDTRAF
ncbi:peptide ABC transporter ATP-binding protein [Zophobihabitans entericus]|uniref:ATP-binding cassette domain-containing protein n=1 Tax=Zophobihabitans entericus TaxID=1635327 RepID=A0A6G9I9D6_9GAMM|nr:ATP-binding cassette domain-containing protein [Zophobihabitans entericus]QIQ20838.1 ATP-binding cassette domain-containing protein [Zophobihabitans entericus]